MQRNTTPILPGFPVQNGGRRRRSPVRVMEALIVEQKKWRLWEFKELFRGLIPQGVLSTQESGSNSRKRVYTTEVVFWAFVFQAINKASCAATVKRIQSWRIKRGLPVQSSNTAGYCKARARLSMAKLMEIFHHSASHVQNGVDHGWHWCGRRVKVIDGTGLSMPDTAASQEVWPQSRSRKVGCGFPQLKLVGIFCLGSGAWLNWEIGNKHNHEMMLWRRLWETMKPGEIILGDRAYCSYGAICTMLANGVDTVTRLHQRRRMNLDSREQIGDNEWLETWTRSKRRCKTHTELEWTTLPQTLTLRVIEYHVEIPGFRTKLVRLATTLMDQEAYPAAKIADLYSRRWQVELFLRDIKSTMRMDVLSTKAPGIILKEIAVYAIAYNLIRFQIGKAAEKHCVDIRRISFKGATDQLEQWLWLFIQSKTASEVRLCVDEFLFRLVDSLHPVRPTQRTEPRARKRRKHKYKLLTQPRREIHVESHRNKHTAQNSIPALS